MSNKFSLQQLSEGIRQRNVGAQNRRLVEKWSRTGLLKGLDGVHRENMATMLENQASDMLIRESSTIGAGGGSGTASGDLRGFTNVAFPIVRRVFGGLVANELVSIQPMSLPAGLLFYLDYTYGSTEPYGSPDPGFTADGASVYRQGQSIYNNPAGKGIRSGSLGVGGQYDLAGTGFTRMHSGTVVPAAGWQTTPGTATSVVSGTFYNNGTLVPGNNMQTSGSDGRLIQFDPQLTTLIEESGGRFYFLGFPTTGVPSVDPTAVREFAVTSGAPGTVLGVVGETVQGGSSLVNVRRLNQLGTYTAGTFTPNPFADTSLASTYIFTVVSGVLGGARPNVTASFVVSDTFSASATGGDSLVIPSFESNFASTPSPAIPEIDIKVESIPVVATTRKLRARWSPELAQDLNAYHSLDAEVELTQILSEQVALEIDREILGDLLTGSSTNYFWSRAPGRFVNKTTGTEALPASATSPGPAFTGTVRDWYETLIETIIDVGNEIHRKTLRGSANFIVVSPDVATILEASVYYRPAYSIDGSGQVSVPFSMGAEKIGSLSNRFTVYKDPYFPRNKILVGYKGGSYLETGYVYAPYVPLIVTPTIFAPEDFTPRKGVMTRYGKKMVRNDFYGTVTVLDLNII
jgi:hypothetical protein